MENITLGLVYREIKALRRELRQGREMGEEELSEKELAELRKIEAEMRQGKKYKWEDVKRK